MLAVILALIVGTILLMDPNANKAFSRTLARFRRSRLSIGFGDDSRNPCLANNPFCRIQVNQRHYPNEQPTRLWSLAAPFDIAAIDFRPIMAE